MSREYPSRPLLGVGAVVLRGDAVLLVRRGVEPSRGKFSIPGGMVELGEEPEEAVVRELMEETGLVGKVVGLFGVYGYVERDEVGRFRYHFVLLDYLVDAKGEPRASSDALEAGFYEIRNALHLDLTETTRRLLMDILRNGAVPCGGLTRVS
jgi:ADP-ribose pyrophosphatase YjhB (NUDIX family)